MIEVLPYEATLKRRWDEVVRTANNGHFMFCRNFMEYHDDRFEDASLMFCDGQRDLSVLPMCINKIG